MNFICFVIFILLNQCSFIENKKFLVSKYGAYPNDHKDDTSAIQTAITEAIKHGSNNIVVFDNGIYDISSDIMVANSQNLTITGQGIDKTFLIGLNPITIFTILNGQGIKLMLFSIDFDPLPFTAGYITDVNEQYLDVEVVSPHKTDIDRQVFAIHRYDLTEMRPAFGPRTYEIYQHPSLNHAKTTIVSPGVLRIPLLASSSFEKGDPIVARYISTGHTIDAQYVNGITIASVHIYTSWRIGLFGTGVKKVLIKDFHVIPRNGRWMSTIVDCMHFSDAREYIRIVDSRCQSMGDDGLNVHALYLLVVEIINSTTIVIDGMTGARPIDVGVGTHLEFRRNELPFIVYGLGTVASIKYHSENMRFITFTNSVDINIHDFVCVGDSPMLTIRNFTVSHNRARGVLLETRNIDIRQSIFNRTSGPAVLIQPSLYWFEGPEARNVTLIQNTFINNNEGIAQQRGVISILPFPVQLVPIFSDITIKSSSFYFGNYSQLFLEIHNTNNMLIKGNYLYMNISSPIVAICNSRNISAQNNVIYTKQLHKLDTYYTLIQNEICSDGSTSLINIPPSAFRHIN